jgi:DUF438 domain-containing protein
MKGIGMAEENRIEILKGLIRDLHRGADVEILKKRFARFASQVSAAEIGEMEQRLIDEGLPPEEIRKLCDLHVEVFEEALGGSTPPPAVPGHPLNTLAAENKAMGQITARMREALERLRAASGDADRKESRARLGGLAEELGQIERHYLKKEYQLFPRLEAKGISGPSKVMWAVHDDIRAHLKDLRRALDLGDAGLIVRTGQGVLREMADMVQKEEQVLFPMALETLDKSDWAEVKKGESEIGYAWIAPPPPWPPAAGGPGLKPAAGSADAAISLDRGVLSREQIDLILTRLPADITFVDENDVVVYYSAGPARVFPRTPGIIGRKVQNCHPPKSLDVVERILRAFRSGERDEAEFWIEMGGRFVHIRYFALRDGAGAYRGVLEVTEDATAVRALRGQRRLLDWDRPEPDGEI